MARETVFELWQDKIWRMIQEDPEQYGLESVQFEELERLREDWFDAHTIMHDAFDNAELAMRQYRSSKQSYEEMLQRLSTVNPDLPAQEAA